MTVCIFISDYPDIGNVSAWNVDIEAEFTKTIHKVTAIHLKDTHAVTPTYKGKFRDVPFGSGCVDFVGFFTLLKKLNYRGSFVLEQWGEHMDDPLAEIIKSKKWMLAQMEAAQYF